MGNKRVEKIREMRTLAEQFREKARATGLADYIKLMTQTAEELDMFANALEQQATERGAANVEQMIVSCDNRSA